MAVPKFHMNSGQSLGVEPQLRVAPGVSASAHEEGLILLNTDTGLMYSTNRIGSQVWGGLIHEESPASIIEQITREYSVTRQRVAADIAILLRDMQKQGLLTCGGRR